MVSGLSVLLTVHFTQMAFSSSFTGVVTADNANYSSGALPPKHRKNSSFSSEFKGQYDDEIFLDLRSIFCTLEKMPEIAQFLKRNISISIQNTPKKISPLYLFFQSENNGCNIVQIRKIYSIAVFMTLQSLPTHLLKN